MTELIIQNYNHPSIMFWGLSNEILIGGICQELVDNHHDLQKLVRELDPTRLTTIAHVSNTPVDGPMHHITDVESYNHYFGWYGGKMEQNGPWLDKFHAEHPDICIGISEYGTEGIINWHSNDPQCKDYTEEYQALYHEHLAQVFEDRPWVWATHCWNMFDFGCAARNEGGVAGRNNKGLMTIDRKTKKDSYFVYQAYWSKQPMVHIAGRRHAQRAGETTEIKVYSNQDTVVLYVNGKEVGQQTAHRVFKFNVALEEGFNTILAVAGDVKDSITLEKVEKEPDCYTLPEFNERQEGVANWFKQVGSLDLKAPMEFPEGYYSIKDSMEELSKNEEALALATRAVKLATNFDIKPGVGMWDMMKRMTPETMAKMINMPDGFIESLNAQLIKIKKEVLPASEHQKTNEPPRHCTKQPPGRFLYAANGKMNQAAEMVNFKPSCWKIFSRVSRLGIVLKDSIRATEDCGIPHLAASSRWLNPIALRCSTIAFTIADIASASRISFAMSGSTAATCSL